MIDGDDRDRDLDDRHLEGNASPVEPSGNPEAETGARTPDDTHPADRAGAPEKKPAMTLESGSDEGGTFAHDAEIAGTVENDGDGVKREPARDPEAFADIDEEDPVLDDENDLGLVSDDDALPWLESSDYEEIESVDAWRVTGFVVLGLVAFALLVGSIWYVVSRNDPGAPQADGSVIEAPEGPYKERPEDPGGKTFEGTGDMAPAVGEGETREGRLAERTATPEPVAEDQAKQDSTDKSEPEPSTPAARDNRIAVQVGAYRDKATAEAGWRQLQRQTDALSGVQYRIVKGEADIGTVYRLQALPGNMAAARRLRSALEDDGVASQIKQ
ncbi:SPOR domain-containing protein [Alteriqipengyuania sp. 357]